MHRSAWVLLIVVMAACASETSDPGGSLESAEGAVPRRGSEPSGASGAAESAPASQAAESPPTSQDVEPTRASQAGPTSSPPLPSALPTVQLVAEYGCEACTGPELFSRIYIVAASASNSIAVLDATAPHVRVWNLDTGAATQFGRSGQGPGELDRPMGIAFLGDSIGVGDFRGRAGRVEFYTSEGAHLGSAPGIVRISFFATSQKYVASPSGRWTLSSERSLLVRTNTESGATDTITIPPSFLERAGAPGGATSAAISDLGEVALGIGEVEYRLAVLSTDGTPRLEGGRDIERRLMSSEEHARSVHVMDSLALAAAALTGRTLALSPPPREIWHFTAGGPYAGALGFDGRGRLWVRTTRGRGTDSTIFDVFGRDLEYLGEVDLGSGVLTHYVGATLIVASVVGDLGVEGVKVWRIREP
jgi:hypothetical protein